MFALLKSCLDFVLLAITIIVRAIKKGGEMIKLLEAHLGQISGVRGCFTTRLGGFSLEPYLSLNLGQHVGDDPNFVAKNRALVQKKINVKSISWLNQIHSNKVVTINSHADIINMQDADAQVTTLKNVGLAIMTADCLPVLFASTNGEVVACAHAGWRGLYNGVISATIAKMKIPPQNIIACMGPCIGANDYEVGDDLYCKFVQKDPTYSVFFRQISGHHFLADLKGIARQELMNLGVKIINDCQHTTFGEPDLFFSYRRSNVTGRMASLIWLE